MILQFLLVLELNRIIIPDAIGISLGILSNLLKICLPRQYWGMISMLDHELINEETEVVGIER
jgi:hypothetical protein